MFPYYENTGAHTLILGGILVVFSGNAWQCVIKKRNKIKLIEMLLQRESSKAIFINLLAHSLLIECISINAEKQKAQDTMRKNV